MDTQERTEVNKPNLTRVAKGLAKAFSTTILLGGGGAVAAPTNEIAQYMFAAGFAIDVFRLVKDRGEQLMADIGGVTPAQRENNQSLNAQIRQKEQIILEDRLNF